MKLLANRPSANNFFNSYALQEFTRATNVRFRLLRVKNLLGHLMSVARQDPTTTRRVSELFLSLYFGSSRLQVHFRWFSLVFLFDKRC